MNSETEKILRAAYVQLAQDLRAKGHRSLASAIITDQRDIEYLQERLQRTPQDGRASNELAQLRRNRAASLIAYKSKAVEIQENPLIDALIDEGKKTMDKEQKPKPVSAATKADFLKPATRRRPSKMTVVAVAAFVGGAALGVLSGHQPEDPAQRIEAAMPAAPSAPAAPEEKEAMNEKCQAANDLAEKLIAAHYVYADHVGDMMLAASKTDLAAAQQAAAVLETDRENMAKIVDDYRAAAAECQS